MNVSPIVFFDMTAAILILSLALIVLVFYLAKAIRHPAINPKDEAPDDARIKALKIIDDANNKAIDIVSRVTLATNEASEEFRQEITKSSSTQIKEFEQAISGFTKIYSQVLQDLKVKNIGLFQSVSKDIEENATKEIKDFKESMRRLTTLSQKEVREKIDSDYKEAQKEIEEYKREELEKINKEIYELLEKTSKLVMGKALSLSDHQDLIEKALEQAKKEGMFKS